HVDKLMKDFNNLYKEGKYLEAESLAMKAMELDPDSGVAAAAVNMARTQRRVNEYRGIKNRREAMVLEGLNDAEDEGPADAIHNGLDYNKERWDKAVKRQPLTPITLRRQGEKEKAIERKLSTPVSLNFENQPLKQVIADLREFNGINIVEDVP